jgi:prepilin-type processing-associated H-X9-DG protein
MTAAAAVGRLSLTFDMDAMYPDYLLDASVLVCPSDRDNWVGRLENPVSIVMDLGHRCEAACRGWALGNSSYTYLGYPFWYLGEQPVASEVLLNVTPFAGDPSKDFWTGAVLTWNRDHPDQLVRVQEDGRGESVPLDLQVFAWAQVIGDTIKHGDPDVVVDMLNDGIWVGGPSAVVLDGSAAFDIKPALINDGPHLFANGTRGVDFDWPGVKASAAVRPVSVGGTNSYETDFLKSPYIAAPVLPDSFHSSYWLNSSSPYRIGRHLDDVRRFYMGPDLAPAPADSRSPVLWDKLSLDVSGRRHNSGFNVLFMDGHVAFHSYDVASDDRPPFTESAMWTIGILQHWVDVQAARKTGIASVDAQCP